MKIDKIFKIIVLLELTIISIFFGYYVLVITPKNEQYHNDVKNKLSEIFKELRDINPDYDESAFDKNPFW